MLSVTVTVPASGVVEVTWDAHARNSSAGAELIGSVALSGANTVTASDDHSFYLRPPTADYITSVTKTHLFTGLTPGSTTFTVKYRVGGGTGTFSRRQLIVRPGG